MADWDYYAEAAADDDDDDDVPPDFNDPEDERRWYGGKKKSKSSNSQRRSRPKIPYSTIEEVRKVCGITPVDPEVSGPSDPEAPGRQVVFVSHAGENDYSPVEQQIKFEFDKSRAGFKKPLAVDTQNVIDVCFFGNAIGRSLASIVEEYQLAEIDIWHFPPPYNKTKKPTLYFKQQHLAANDAQKTLESLMCLMTDRRVLSFDSDFEDGQGIRVHKHLSAGTQPTINMNAILFAFDTEKIRQSETLSELGVAWLDLSKVSGIQPGPYCENWRPYIEIRQYRVMPYESYSQPWYMAGKLPRRLLASSNDHRQATTRAFPPDQIRMCLDQIFEELGAVKTVAPTEVSLCPPFSLNLRADHHSV